MEKGSPCVCGPCDCGGYDHPVVSVHEPLCHTLNRSSSTFDRVPVDRLRRWQDAGVWMQRVWTVNAYQPHWRGSTAINPLWSAMELYNLTPKYQIPDTVERLVARCLTDEKTLVTLEFLAEHPEAVETKATPLDWTESRARALLWYHAVVAVIDPTSADLLRAARRWRAELKEGT